MNQQNENLQVVTQEITPARLPADHPFVGAVYGWFEDGNLDAARFEEETEEKISWAVITKSGFRMWHSISLANDGEMTVRSVAILGGIDANEREKAKEKLLNFNMDFPCLYRFSLDEDDLIIMEFCATTQALSKGSYEILLEGMIPWADCASEKLKEAGFSVDRKAKDTVQDENKKAG